MERNLKYICNQKQLLCFGFVFLYNTSNSFDVSFLHPEDLRGWEDSFTAGNKEGLSQVGLTSSSRQESWRWGRILFPNFFHGLSAICLNWAVMWCQEAKEKFQQLQKVISILGDEEKRALYDQTGIADDDVSTWFQVVWFPTFHSQ